MKEALALCLALSAASHTLANSRVDARTDCLPLVQAWKNQGGKSADLNAVIKSIFELTLPSNISLTVCHVPSKANVADAPSRALSEADCMLSSSSWAQIQNRWGPHTVDLMSLDSRLSYFSPWPTPGSAGVNIVAQSLSTHDNAYVFHPVVLIGPVFRFLQSLKRGLTLVIPDIFPWWPMVRGRASDKLLLGTTSQHVVLLFPSREGVFVSKPLPWDLWAFRLNNLA